MKKILVFVSLLCMISWGLVACVKDEFDVKSEIKLYTRGTESGTRDGFFTGIGLSEAKESNEPLKYDGLGTMETNGDMIYALKNDVYGIGYISMTSLANSSLKGVKYEGVDPTEENVLNGTYTLTRNFNYIVRTEFSSSDKQEIIEAFKAYLGTQEGKTIMKSEGGILEISNHDPKWEDIKDNYEITKKDNSNITIYFGGSTSVSSMAQALAKEFSNLCGNVKFSHDYHGSGDAYKKTQGAQKDATGYYDMAFASRDFKITGDEKAQEGTYGKICIDAIVVVVNAKNECSSLTADDLVKIYTGVYRKWNELI